MEIRGIDGGGFAGGGADSAEHTVKTGDTFEGIAKQYGFSPQELLAANPQIKDPGSLQPGQALLLPALQNEETSTPSFQTDSLERGDASSIFNPQDSNEAVSGDEAQSKLLPEFQINQALVNMPLIGNTIANTATAPRTVASPESKDFGHQSASGPISKEEWADPTKLMAKLTQYPAGQATDQSNSTCGPSNLLGATMLSGGPDAVATMLKSAAAAPSQLTTQEKTQLEGIAKKVADHTATFGDLNKAQELLYRGWNTEARPLDTITMAMESPKLTTEEKGQVKTLMDNYLKASPLSKDDALKKLNHMLSKAFGVPTDFSTGDDGSSMKVAANRHTTDTSGMTDKELEALGGAAGHSKSESYTDDPSAALAKLKNGEALTFRVQSGGVVGVPDHFVTVGKTADGKPYIYNPDPAGPRIKPGKGKPDPNADPNFTTGDSTLVVGTNPPDAAFLKQLARYDARVSEEDTDSGPSEPPVLRSKF